MSSPLSHLCTVLLLAGLSSSCVLAIGDSTAHPYSKAKSTDSKLSDTTGAALNGSKSEGQGAKVAVGPEAAKKKADRKAEKKAREVTYAKMELTLAEMEATNDLRDANFDVERAHNDLESAQRDLDHYLKQERPLDLEDAQIDLDRGTESALEKRQELDELIAMYKKDEFAKMTKELVLQRGKVSMELVQREVELSKKRAADKKAHAMVVKERDLSLAVTKAQQGVTAAEAKLQKTQAHNELELLRARQKVEDAERPDEDEDASGAEAPKAEAPKTDAPTTETPKTEPQKPDSKGM